MVILSPAGCASLFHVGGFKHVIRVHTKSICVLGTIPNKPGCGLAEMQEQSDANAEHNGAVGFSCFSQADFAVTMLRTVRLRLMWGNHLKGSVSFSKHLKNNSHNKKFSSEIHYNGFY